MNKLFINKEFEKLKRVNTLPFRSFYIPFKSDDIFDFKEGIIDKNSSSLYISLNGEWLFKEHKGYEQIQLDEKMNEYIDVPSCVQTKGYDYHQYTNWLYPFHFNPPFVPTDNPLFHYRKIINLKLKDKYYLNFDGVDSAFYLYINNKYVGYSQISHSTSEFDITSFLNDGENIIDVIVLKWCASSYLEDQDKFRFSGIFRDVYILNRKEEHIRDYKIQSINKDNKWYISVINLSNDNFNVSFNNDVRVVKPLQEELFLVNNVILWSTTNPYLYDVIIFNNYEKILERIGLRKVNIIDGVFYINDKHIKLKGVNRNETHPDRGCALTLADTINDLKIIKSLGINAIRTSHYQNMPEFYMLCDLMGIYVVAEADVETHGAVSEKYDLKLWQDFANNGIFDEGVLDREISLYEREKNRTSVVIWSIGNEASYGRMFYEGIDYIHTHDDRPIQYEGLYSLVDKKEYYTSRIDICSRMYPSIEDIKDNYLNDKNETRPLLICEYSHAMGNSCGDIKDYWDLINSSNRIIGAFVWEFCDHAVNVNNKLLYGSDFPTHHNDGNFCLDGIVSPYRKIKTNALEVKAIYKGEINEDKEINVKPLLSVNDNNALMCSISDERPEINEIFSNNKNVLLKPIKVNLLRPFIDNERDERYLLEKLLNAKHVIKVKNIKDNLTIFNVDVKDDNDKYLSYCLNILKHNKGLDITLSYELFSDIRPTRIGLGFAMEKVDGFIFDGYGPLESYVDKHHYAKFDTYQINLKDDFEDNLKPQESGSHYSSVRLETKDLLVLSDKPFSFNILPYSFDTLINTNHNYELIEDDKVYINLDLFMSGVGSHSCGPVLDEKYRVPKKGKGTFRIIFK